MAVYSNKYFKLKASFPDAWRLSSWSTWKRPPPELDRYQLADDDLPESINTHKCMLTASVLNRANPAQSTSLFLEVHKRSSNFDLSKAISTRWEEVERECYGNTRANQSLLIVQRKDDFYCKTKVIAWEALPEIWLCATMTAYSDNEFDSIVEIFNGIDRCH